MTRSANQRGFVLYEFEDTHKAKCALQESSAALSSYVWLGKEGHEMHVDQKLARQIVERLTIFIQTGGL